MDSQPVMVQAAFDLFAGWHVLILLFLALLIFGRRLPELMKNLGGSVKEFKKGMEDGPKDQQNPYHAAPPTALPAPPPAIDGAISRPSTSVPSTPASSHPVPPSNEPPQQH